MDIPSRFVDLLYQGWTKSWKYIYYLSLNKSSKFFAWGKVFEQSFLVQCVTFWEVRLDQKAYYGQSVDSLEPCSIQFFCTGITSSSWFLERQTFSPLTRGQVANYCNMDEVKAFQTRPKQIYIKSKVLFNNRCHLTSFYPTQK